jgi:hypothetical protein
MSAILRAFGKHFDVDAFLAHCRLPVRAVKRLGEPVYKSQPDGRRHTASGVNVSVSEADFSEFPLQVKEAIIFLQTNESEVRRLCAFPGVVTPTLDFGIDQRDVPIQCDRLPRELLRLAGSLGLDIEVSKYLPRDKLFAFATMPLSAIERLAEYASEATDNDARADVALVRKWANEVYQPLLQPPLRLV